jgi:hypothetical protein
MNSTLSDIGIAILLVVVATALIVWFCRTLEAASRSRLRRMMQSFGLNPDKLLTSDGGICLNMHEVRVRCRKCPAEDQCERWLAGEIDGDNDFCPNSKIFGEAASTFRNNMLIEVR